MKRLRARLTYANVVATLALFLVVAGGSAFAAGQLGKNSVGPKQLKKNAVTAAKIKNNAVTTAKIKNGAITGAKVNTGSLGTVPNATRADTAGNADSVSGVGAQEINFAAVSGTQVIYSRSGLTLTATCTSDELSIVATTSKANSSIYTSVVDTDADNNNLNDDLETGGFDPGIDFDLLSGNDGNPGLVTFVYDNSDGSTATGNLSVDESNTPNCQAHGVVLNG